MSEEEHDWEKLVCDWCKEVIGYVCTDAYGVCASYYHYKVICSTCKEKEKMKEK